jgi:hypothetical protein
VFTVLITGPPGAGKTSVLTALVDALTDDDVAHAAIELETLAWTHPALSEQAWLRHLEAPPATLVDRIVERGPDSWSGLAGLVEHTQELAVSMPALQGVDLVVSTDGERPQTVAQRIRAALPGELVAPERQAPVR